MYVPTTGGFQYLSYISCSAEADDEQEGVTLESLHEVVKEQGMHTSHLHDKQLMSISRRTSAASRTGESAATVRPPSLFG